jgi:hypothetical protein
MNLSSKELAVASQSQLDGFKNPNKRAMLGAMGINVGNVQEAQGIKSILQSAVAGQGAQQMAPGGSIVARIAEEAFAQYQEKIMAQKQQEEMMKVAMGFRGMEPANGVGSLPVPGQDYAEGGIVPFAKGGQPKVAAKEKSWEEAALEAGKEQAADYMAAYPKPEQIDREVIFNRAFESNQEMGKPYIDKMNELIQKMRPDENKIRATNESRGIIEAGLAMMQARGGPGFAGGLAGIAGGAQRGLNQYQEGEQSLQNQLQKHRAFQMEGIKNELGMRKDDLRYAQGMAEEARKEYGLNSREHTKALVQAGQIQREVMRLATEAEKLRQKEAEALRRAENDTRKLEILAARGGPGGGGGGAGNRASEWDRRQAFAEYRKILSDPQHPKVREFKAMLKQDPAYKEADKDTQKRMMSEGLPAFVAQSIEDDFGIRPYPNAAGIKSVAPAAPAAGKPPPGKNLGPLIP